MTVNLFENCFKMARQPGSAKTDLPRSLSLCVYRVEWEGKGQRDCLVQRQWGRQLPD